MLFFYYLLLRVNYDIESTREFLGIYLLLGRISNRCKMFKRHSVSSKTWAETPENVKIAKIFIVVQIEHIQWKWHCYPNTVK